MSPDELPGLWPLLALILWLIVLKHHRIEHYPERGPECLHLSRLDRLDGLTCSECDE